MPCLHPNGLHGKGLGTEDFTSPSSQTLRSGGCWDLSHQGLVLTNSHCLRLHSHYIVKSNTVELRCEVPGRGKQFHADRSNGLSTAQPAVLHKHRRPTSLLSACTNDVNAFEQQPRGAHLSMFMYSEDFAALLVSF